MFKKTLLRDVQAVTNITFTIWWYKYTLFFHFCACYIKFRNRWNDAVKKKNIMKVIREFR